MFATITVGEAQCRSSRMEIVHGSDHVSLMIDMFFLK